LKERQVPVNFLLARNQSNICTSDTTGLGLIGGVDHKNAQWPLSASQQVWGAPIVIGGKHSPPTLGPPDLHPQPTETQNTVYSPVLKSITAEVKKKRFRTFCETD